ncbi:MAG: hypothetical protein KAJ97_01370 [Acidobacteria bacterium]|nr:hypothetical protein [Acidobacteriota bacterium]
MTTPKIRPRFTIEVDADPDVLMDRLRENLKQCPCCTGVSVGRHAELFVPGHEQRVWSPWLSVTTEEGGDGAVLKGRFAPHPSVWTLYLFLTFALGFALLVGISWGYAQWVMEQTPWALLSLPGAIILGGLLFLASVLGQRLGAEQMVQLRAALEELTR